MEGSKFQIYSDHEALKWLLGLTDVSGRLACWRLRLAEFDFSIEYKIGKKTQIADALFRIPTDGETHVSPNLEIPVLNTETSSEEDKIYAHVCEHIMDNEDLLDWYTVLEEEYNFSGQRKN